jgi:general secretion pathway protein C
MKRIHEILLVLGLAGAAAGAIVLSRTPRAATAPAVSSELPVARVAEGVYEIPRPALDEVLGNVGRLTRAARVVPELREGKVVGVRLFSVRAGSPLAALGLQTGDVVRLINGHDLTSPERVLQLYTALKTCHEFSLAMERAGQPITNHYVIR